MVLFVEITTIEKYVLELLQEQIFNILITEITEIMNGLTRLNIS